MIKIAKLVLLMASVSISFASHATVATMKIHSENGKKLFNAVFDSKAQTGFISANLDWDQKDPAVTDGYELASAAMLQFNSPSLPDNCYFVNLTGSLLDSFQDNSTIRIDFRGDCAQYFKDFFTDKLQINFIRVRHQVNTEVESVTLQVSDLPDPVN